MQKQRCVTYIIPGNTENEESQPYPKIVEMYKKRGDIVKVLNIDWSQPTLTDFLNEGREFFDHQEDDIINIFGFSFGAMMALVYATELQVNELILCSVSPFFKEIIDDLPQEYFDYYSETLMDDFRKYSIEAYVPKLKQKKLSIMVGQNENDCCQRTGISISQKTKTDLIHIPNNDHVLNDEEYINTIRREIM